MRNRFYLVIAALAIPMTCVPALAQVDVTVNTCATTTGTVTGHVEWPASDPLWTFDFIRPEASTGDDGSGLELRDVYYDGNLVLGRAHVPVLNVEYDGSGCSCFRDWSDSETGFRVDQDLPPNSQPGGCVFVADPGDVTTTCDSNEAGGSGGNTGNFEGVAVEEFPGELVLTTHMSAGWYRYRMKWHFYEDGRIWPEYSFSAASATCTDQAHRHHAYWRFDFDIAGSGGDAVSEINPTTETTIEITSEADRTWGNGTDGIYWRVGDGVTGLGYQIVPSSADLMLPVDPFSKTDALIARYDGTVDDAGGGCAINYSNIINGETVQNEDIVFWYRSGALHNAGNPWECDIVGPTLIPDHITVPTIEGPSELVDGYVLESAYPNPFNPSTTVRFKVADKQNVTVSLLDALGRQVATLFTGFVESNHFETVRIDGSRLPSGTYTVRLEGESVFGSTRIALIK